MRLRVLLPAVLAACPPPDDTTPVETDPPEAEVDAGPDVEVPVGVPVTLRATGGVEAPRWDLGDGTRAEGWEVTHVYTAPGNHVAKFAVRRADGSTAVDDLRVTVYRPAADPAPVASSTVVVADGLAWVAVPEADAVTVVMVEDGTRLGELPACDAPRTVAPWRGGVVVACEGEDALALLDADGTIGMVALPVGARPYGVVVRGDTAWVTAPGLGAVLRVDLPDGEITTLPVGPDPRALVVDPDGVPLATRFRAAQDRGELLRPEAPIPLPKDPGPDSDTGNRGVFGVLRALAMSPDGGSVYVGGTVSNVDRGLFRNGQPLTFETTTRAQVRVLRDGVEDVAARRQFDNHGDVAAFALTPRGNWLWLAHQGTGTLVRLDAYTLRTTGSIQKAGRGVDGLAVTPDGGTLLVHAWLDRELRAYDLTAGGSAPPLRWVVPTVVVEPLDPQVLRGKQLFHDAADPRLARDGYQACATCHPDGGDDGLVWDFTNRGEGLRNTIPLVGRGGTAHGPVHWTGNFDEIQDFEIDVRNGQGGTGLLSASDWDETHAPLGPPKAGRSADLDALAAYVASLDTFPRSPFPEPEGGAERFEAAGCAVCHPPPRYTDSAPGVRHDVGTLTKASGQRLGGPLDGLDTPTLRGVHASAPYLHDGSALTVEDAIGAHDPEVLTAPLSDDDVALLADFVRSLD